MSKYKLFLIAILFIGCGDDDKESEEKTLPTSKWSTAYIEDFADACVEGVMDDYSETVNDIQAYMYCRCFGEQLAQKYTIQEFEDNFTYIVDVELKGPIPSICRKRAGTEK
jgi:hypothetical protein